MNSEIIKVRFRNNKYFKAQKNTYIKLFFNNIFFKLTEKLVVTIKYHKHYLIWFH